MRTSYTPTVQELRALIACGRLGTASRAAEELHLTQSAISRSIRSLEERLGVRLFQRVRQRLLLSDAGRAFIHDAERILGNLDATARMVMAFGSGDRVLRLAVLPTFATTWLIPRLEGFASIAPDVALDVTAALDPVDFQAEPFDAAIQRQSMAMDGTLSIPLMEERLLVVATPEIALRIGNDLHRLMRHPLIQQATRPRLWADCFEATGIGPVDHLRGPRFQHFYMVMAAVRAGLGVALLPGIFVQKDLEDGTLSPIANLSFAGPSPYALIYPEKRQMNESLATFTEWLRGDLRD